MGNLIFGFFPYELSLANEHSPLVNVISIGLDHIKPTAK